MCAAPINSVGGLIDLIAKLEDPSCLQKQKHTLQKQLLIADELKGISEKVRVLSFNVLFDCTEQQTPVEHRWPARLPRVVDVFKEIKPDIIGVQELYPQQKADLIAQIGDDFSFYVGDLQKGELNGIFYRKDRFEIDKDYDLNETQDLLKSGAKRLPFDRKEHEEFQKAPAQDALSPELEPGKMFTILHLIDKKTGRKFAIVNAHFTFRKIQSRACQAQYIAEKILKPLAEKKAVIFTGDLNTFPNRGDLPNLPFLDGNDIHALLSRKSGMRNAIYNALLGHIGMSGSTNDPAKDKVKPFEGIGTPGVFTDHIYVSDRIQVIVHAVVTAWVGGLYPSDHRPLLVDCLIEDGQYRTAQQQVEEYFFPEV